MLNVSDDRLVIEENGIYSLEKFLVARRLMYWQVYMHKTVLSAEKLLVLILKRARELTDAGKDLSGTPALDFFLHNIISLNDLNDKGQIPSALLADNFIKLDDSDIISSTKIWCECNDFVLSDLCRRLMNRDLLAVELQNDPFPDDVVNYLRNLAGNLLGIPPELIDYYVFTDCVSNLTYAPDAPDVKILLKSGETKEISLVSDMFDHKSLSERITKYFLCYPKECRTKK
jgi:HD superfamily phosphohydrolase